MQKRITTRPTWT